MATLRTTNSTLRLRDGERQFDVFEQVVEPAAPTGELTIACVPGFFGRACAWAKVRRQTTAQATEDGMTVRFLTYNNRYLGGYSRECAKNRVLAVAERAKGADDLPVVFDVHSMGFGHTVEAFTENPRFGTKRTGLVALEPANIRALGEGLSWREVIGTVAGDARTVVPEAFRDHDIRRSALGIVTSALGFALTAGVPRVIDAGRDILCTSVLDDAAKLAPSLAYLCLMTGQHDMVTPTAEATAILRDGQYDLLHVSAETDHVGFLSREPFVSQVVQRNMDAARAALGAASIT